MRIAHITIVASVCFALVAFAHDVGDDVVPENDFLDTELVQGFDVKDPKDESVLAESAESAAAEYGVGTAGASVTRRRRWTPPPPPPPPAPPTPASPTPMPQQYIKFDHYISDTAPPPPDIEPAPGTMNLQNGIDRFDGERGLWPVFKWTWAKYSQSMTDAKFERWGHERELWLPKDGPGEDETEQVMVPDQLFVTGPDYTCESASNAKTEVITNSDEMSKSEGKSQSMSYEQSASVEAGAGPAGMGGDMSSNMQSGSSQSSKDFQKAVSRGQTRSAFSSTTSIMYDVALVDPTSLHPIFKKAVEVLKAQPEITDDLLRLFTLKFGTDYFTAVKLGGRVTQQTTSADQSKSHVSNSELAQESSKSFGATFGASLGPVSGSQGGSMSKSQNTASGQTTETAVEKGTETHQAKFEGGLANPDYHEWCNSVIRKPVPIKYYTDSIFNLVYDVIGEKELGVRMQEYLLVRQKQEASCSEGQMWDKRQNKCAAGACKAGNIKQEVKKAKAALDQFAAALLQLEKEHLPSPEATMLQEASGSQMLSATQSSEAYGGAAARAVDGNSNGNYGSGSCTHTNTQRDPWWRVDLGEEKSVTAVKVFNRDDCCGERLAGYQVKVGNEEDWSKGAPCGSAGPLDASSTQTCSTSGRYVNVVLPGDNKILSLCEVQVTAGPKKQEEGVDFVMEEACVPCPPGTYMGGPQDTECTPCNEGMYSDEGSAMCQMCPPGLTSDKGSGDCPYFQGSFNILANGKCSLGKATKGRGDNSIDDGNVWAYFDCASKSKKVQIKHLDGDTYQVTTTGLWLGGSIKGDKSKGGAKGWAMWQASESDVTIKRTGGDNAVISWDNNALKANAGGDAAKQCVSGRRRKGSDKCPWAAFGSGNSAQVTLKSTM